MPATVDRSYDFHITSFSYHTVCTRLARELDVHTYQGLTRLDAGDVLPARSLTTVSGDDVAIPDAHAVVHLQFRRFASCPICNVHLRTFARRNHELLAAGIREIAVFHSTREAMLPHQGRLPFATVPDPAYTLYREFGIEFSYRAVLDPRAWTSPLKPYAWVVGVREALSPGARPLSTRGQSMLGMPADLLIGIDGTVLEAKYGRHANDHWTVDDVVTLACRDSRPGAI